MIPRISRELTSTDGGVNILEKYGSIAVAIEAVNGDATFTELQELNQLGEAADSYWKSKTLIDGKMIYGKFSYIQANANTLYIHLK